ncbi:MAG: ATP-dependent nuclease subunit A, partial [Gemmatimonadaceae bacterium]|nr:ATP-dependent nuclease subunit A [Gloeobacterales cyanobacterium ES-bin-141]
TGVWDPLDLYGEALAAFGIPAVHAGGGNLLDTREAKDAAVLLAFLANPTDNLSLATVLRSPFFAVDDLTLYRFVQSLPRDNTAWWSVLADSRPAELEQPVGVLTGLLRNRVTQPPHMLLRCADRECGYSAVAANLANGRRRLADWGAFLDLVRTLAGGIGDCLSVTRRLQNLIAAEVKVPRPPLEAVNAVSLMTIHAAKGLEWPVVVVADLTRKPNNNSPPILVNPEIGIGMDWTDEGGEARKPALYRLLNRLRKLSEQEEARRLLYVALTRAKDLAVLTSTEASGGKLDLLLPGLQTCGVPLQAHGIRNESSR